MLLELKLAITGTGVGRGLPSRLKSRERSTGTVSKPFLRRGPIPVLRPRNAIHCIADPLFLTGAAPVVPADAHAGQRAGQRQVRAVTNSNSHRQ